MGEVTNGLKPLGQGSQPFRLTKYKTLINLKTNNMEIKTRYDQMTPGTTFISVINHHYSDSINHQLIGGFFDNNNYKPVFGTLVGQWKIKYKSK